MPSIMHLCTAALAKVTAPAVGIASGRGPVRVEDLEGFRSSRAKPRRVRNVFGLAHLHVRVAGCLARPGVGKCPGVRCGDAGPTRITSVDAGAPSYTERSGVQCGSDELPGFIPERRRVSSSLGIRHRPATENRAGREFRTSDVPGPPILLAPTRSPVLTSVRRARPPVGSDCLSADADPGETNVTGDGCR